MDHPAGHPLVNGRIEVWLNVELRIGAGDV
jgi:hypothetical protein